MLLDNEEDKVESDNGGGSLISMKAMGASAGAGLFGYIPNMTLKSVRVLVDQNI